MQCPSNSLQFHAEAGRAWPSPCRPLPVTGTMPASVMSWDHDVCDICDASVQPTRWPLSDRDSCATVYSLCQRLSGTYLRMPACSFLSISTRHCSFECTHNTALSEQYLRRRFCALSQNDCTGRHTQADSGVFSVCPRFGVTHTGFAVRAQCGTLQYKLN